MPSEKSEMLRAAMRDQTLMRFEQRFEAGWVNGYVLAVGPKFFVLAALTSGIHLRGFQCFRIADVRKLRPNPYLTFIEAALAARGEVKISCQVDVTNIATLITSASETFPLITIHEEALYPDECRIGRLQSIKRGSFALLEINPDASWDEEPTHHKLADITRVDFGDDYEHALYLVGGEPS